ncbi:hypothetical protein MXB_1317 [Myxobolus squamalis]|nr:hypothetical protein MXB_1317 [Myxobolus squamalis]
MKVAALHLCFWKLLANGFKQTLFEVASYVLWLLCVIGHNNYLVQHLDIVHLGAAINQFICTGDIDIYYIIMPYDYEQLHKLMQSHLERGINEHMLVGAKL